MAKFEFKKDNNRKKNIEKTEISKPKNEFNLEEFKSKEEKKSDIQEQEVQKSKVGRPSKNRQYTSLRIQKTTSFKVNAMVNVLELESVDELISLLLDEKMKQFSSADKTMFDMYVKTYQNRNNKKNRLKK